MPRSAKATGKVRTPSWDSHSSFNRQQQTPYARSPHSVRSSSSVPSSVSPGGSSGSATKKANSTSVRIKNELHEKLSDFTWKSESRMEEDDQRTRHYVARLNYAVWDKEMEMQRDQLTTEHANADLIHHRELDCMQKDIELKNAEENCIAQQIEMLRLQIQLEGMRQGHSPP